MWPSALSGRLCIVALVGRYLTNQLMHRRSIRARSLSAPLTQSRCRLCPYPVSASVSESSPGRTGRFPTCYSPVRHSSPEGPSFDLHVLGMPPAFILSQDQTLHLIRLFFFNVFSLTFSSSFCSFSFSGVSQEIDVFVSFLSFLYD